MNDEFEERLEAQLRALPREIAPKPEVWMAIERRIHRRSSVWILPAAAALVLAVGVAGTSMPGGDRGRAVDDVTAAASPVVATSAPVADPLLPHEAEVQLAVANLREVYEGRREQLEPELVQLFDREIDSVRDAVQTSRQALARDPSDPHLQQMLDHAYAHQLQLFKHAVSTRGKL